jgi:hypothetical protein
VDARRLLSTARLLLGSRCAHLPRTHPVLPAIRATTHVDGKATLSSELRLIEVASKGATWLQSSPTGAGATGEPLARRRTRAPRPEQVRAGASGDARLSKEQGRLGARPASRAAQIRPKRKRCEAEARRRAGSYDVQKSRRCVSMTPSRSSASTPSWSGWSSGPTWSRNSARATRESASHSSSESHRSLTASAVGRRSGARRRTIRASRRYCSRVRGCGGLSTQAAYARWCGGLHGTDRAWRQPAGRIVPGPRTCLGRVSSRGAPWAARCLGVLHAEPRVPIFVTL